MLLFVFAALNLVVLPVAIFGLLAGTVLFAFILSGWLPLSSVGENCFTPSRHSVRAWPRT
jgi:hypothetical protein